VPDDHYDLLVLGSGAAGLAAARSAAGPGRRVGIIEQAELGGDCTHYGCVPSKALLETARRVQGARDGERYGFRAVPTVDFAAVMDRVQAVITEVALDEDEAALRRQGLDVLLGRAAFTGPHTLRLSSTARSAKAPAGGDLHLGWELRADRFVLATGAGPLVPPIDGLDDVPYLTNRTIFALRTLPEHLLVLGGGPIGCELAQAFRRLGAQVTLIEGADRLLGNDEPEAGKVLLTVLRREGVTVRLGATVSSAARSEARTGTAGSSAAEARVAAGRAPGAGAGAGPPEAGRTGAAGTGAAGTGAAGVRVTLEDGGTVEGSHLLVAVGRRPDTGNLGLEAAGVAVEEPSGRITVDGHLRTSAAHVWAVGDCSSRFQFTHAGDEQGRLAGRNAFARGRGGTWSARTLPWVTFTEPEVGHVGLTEAQAYAEYGELARVAHVAMRGMDRARAAGETDGFVKLIAAPNRLLRSKFAAKVVGFTAVCPGGGELVAEAALAMRAGTLAARLAQTTHAYPTWSLATRVAAAQLFGEYAGQTARPARG